jgi:hypothetical protein
MAKNTLRNPPQPRNQLPTTQSLSRYPTCVTIPVTCRRCLPSLAPPYPLKLPPNRHIMAYGKNTLRNPPQPRNQLPTTQSLSRYPTCVTIPVTCRRCLPSLAPPYPLKLPPNRHIMAYGKKHAAKQKHEPTAKPPTTTEPPTPQKTQSLSRYPTCVTIPVTCRRCLPSLVPPYPLKLPPNRHIMAYGKKHPAKPPTTTEPTPQNTKSLHISNVRHHPRHMPSLPPLSRTPLSPKITPKPSHYGLWQKTPCETPHNHGTNSPEHKVSPYIQRASPSPSHAVVASPPSHPLIP